MGPEGQIKALLCGPPAFFNLNDCKMSKLADKPIGARPFTEHDHGNLCHKAQDGMTLREHYAGLAMQGLNANPEWTMLPPEGKAQQALEDADALIRELEKTQP